MRDVIQRVVNKTSKKNWLAVVAQAVLPVIPLSSFSKSEDSFFLSSFPEGISIPT